MPTRLLGAGLLAMALLSCQPIEQEPPAPPVVNHPPRIVEDFLQPAEVVLKIDATSVSVDPHACDPIVFSVGQVEDVDLDQPLVERWVVDLQRDAQGHLLSNTRKVSLIRLANSPSFAADPENAYVLDPRTLLPSTTDPGNPGAITHTHTVQVFVSDGFDSNADDLTPLKGRYVVSRPWVINVVGTCP